jgi:hypothetical protein
MAKGFKIYAVDFVHLNFGVREFMKYPSRKEDLKDHAGEMTPINARRELVGFGCRISLWLALVRNHR